MPSAHPWNRIPGIPPSPFEPSMLHLLRWPSPSATSDSSLSDDKCEKAFPSRTASSVASSATHLPEAESQTHTCFVGEETASSLDGLPCSRPLTTLRILVAHIG